jgi:hypothetical protein
MCGAPKTQEVVTRTELDPNLQRMLYGGRFPGASPLGGLSSLGGAADAGGTSGGGNDDGGFTGGNAVTNRTPEEQNRATDNLRRVKNAMGMDTGPSAASRANAGYGGQGVVDGGLYAMGGVVTPQQGLASLNQGQMPMMNGQMPNLSDPMTAATLAMAIRSPQMQYGSIAGNPMMQTNFNVGGYVEGPGTGTSDSIDSVIMQNGQPVQQAKLSDGEFVMTERAVKGAGNGDREAGAARMYELMQKFERGGRV